MTEARTCINDEISETQRHNNLEINKEGKVVQLQSRMKERANS